MRIFGARLSRGTGKGPYPWLSERRLRIKRVSMKNTPRASKSLRTPTCVVARANAVSFAWGKNAVEDAFSATSCFRKPETV